MALVHVFPAGVVPAEVVTLSNNKHFSTHADFKFHTSIKTIAGIFDSDFSMSAVQTPLVAGKYFISSLDIQFFYEVSLATMGTVITCNCDEKILTPLCPDFHFFIGFSSLELPAALTPFNPFILYRDFPLSICDVGLIFPPSTPDVYYHKTLTTDSLRHHPINMLFEIFTAKFITFAIYYQFQDITKNIEPLTAEALKKINPNGYASNIGSIFHLSSFNLSYQQI